MRAAPAIISTAVLAVVAAGVGVAVASDGGEPPQVGAVDVGAVTVDAAPSTTPSTTPSSGATGDPAATPTASASPAPVQQVEGLDVVQGILTRDDDDADDDDADDADDLADFEVAGVDLGLGPDSWLVGAGPIADFDRDGTTRPVLEELEALVGQEVTAAGRLGEDDSDDSDDRSDDDRSDDDDLVVYEINGLTFRDSAGGPAPWQSATAGGSATDQDAVVATALDAVGAGSRLDSVDREDDGGAAWEVEVVDADGVEQRVLLDAAGAVLDIRVDD